MGSNGFIVWLTGLSGAGKSTLADELARRLYTVRRGVEVLDGDAVRETLSRGLGFSREDRDTNVHRIGFVARLLARNGVGVLVAAISPYRDTRGAVRDEAERAEIPFLEVYCRCPLDVLVERDVKGLYRRALAGELVGFTGIDDPYEAPVVPDCIVDSSVETVEESARRVLTLLVTRLDRVGEHAAEPLQPTGLTT